MPVNIRDDVSATGIGSFAGLSVATSLPIYIGGKLICEIFQTNIQFFNTNGNTMVYVDFNSGNVYTRGNFFADSIDFP